MSDSWLSRPSASRPNPGELMSDYRARLIQEQAQAVERRQTELAEQSSIRNAPGERIRIWERLHGVSLPRDPTHRLIAVIAAGTELALEQVLEEQQRRLDPDKASALGPDTVSDPATPQA
jgi:hypothetical protein